MHALGLRSPRHDARAHPGRTRRSLRRRRRCGSIWSTPTVQEDKLVEQLLGIAVPTREEMQEIEVSSRLYVENGARYMTATLMCQSDTATPKTTPVTFILSGHRLATVRYDEPRPVRHRRAQAGARLSAQGDGRERADGSARRGDRPRRRHSGAHRRRGRPGLAFDLRAGATRPSPPSYKDVLKALGRKGDLTSKVRESLVSIGRLLSVPRQRSRQHEMAEGHARAAASRCSAT